MRDDMCACLHERSLARVHTPALTLFHVRTHAAWIPACAGRGSAQIAHREFRMAPAAEPMIQKSTLVNWAQNMRVRERTHAH